MEPQQFKTGDIVLLKSGGLPMCTSYVKPGGEKIACIWHGSDGSLNESEFATEILELAEENERYILRRKHDLLRMQIEFKNMQSLDQQASLQQNGIEVPGHSRRFPKHPR